MRILIFLFGSIFLFGCASVPCEPIVKIKEVPKVIYKNPPAPKDIPKPSLPVDSLKDGDSPDNIAKAYVASLKLLKDYTKKLEISLEPYKNNDREN